MNATTIKDAGSLSISAIVLGFIAYSAEKYGRHEFPCPLARRDQWCRLLHSLKESFGDHMPPMITSLSSPDWDGEVPEYREFDDAISSMLMHGVMTPGNRWLLIDREMRPALIGLPDDISEKMFQLALAQGDFLNGY